MSEKTPQEEPSDRQQPGEPQAASHVTTLRRYGGLVAGVVLFAAMIAAPPPEAMPAAAWRVAACAGLMAVWWLSEAVPVAATALVPLVLFPPFGIAPIRDAAAPYANPLIYLFLGGFLIALSMQRWNLHRRIALAILRRAGSGSDRLIGGFMIATAFLSMWVSNTATTVMMLPIALSVIAMTPGDTNKGATRAFDVALLLGIAYAASIGGIATLIGTPPNALLAAFLADRHGIELGFARWMTIGLPLAAVTLAVAWLLLTRVLFVNAGHRAIDAAAVIADESAALGPLSGPERRVAAIFLLVAASWMARPALEGLIPGLSDAGIAIAGALAMFAIPAGTGDGRFLLNWEWARKLPWEVLILFGGGLSLAAAINATGLAAWIGDAMQMFSVWPKVAVILAVTAVVIFLTELTSNTATAATFLPLTAALAATLSMPVAELAVPAALAASCAFMMPVATPPNAIVYGSGLLSVGQMARAGIWLNVAATLLITAAVYTLFRFVFDG